MKRGTAYAVPLFLVYIRIPIICFHNKCVYGGSLDSVNAVFLKPD